MKSNLYLIFDRVAGFYSKPFLANNDAVAVRGFKAYVGGLDQNIQGDIELYKVGCLEENTGNIVSCPPEFLCRGVE